MLQALGLRPFSEAGRQRVVFKVPPQQCNRDTTVIRSVGVIDERIVPDSADNGLRQMAADRSALVVPT